MWIYIFIFAIISLYLVFRASLKVCFHFWSQQPVFHFYDLSYYLTPHQIVDASPPPIDSYVNLIDIQVTSYEECPEETRSRMVELIQHHYAKECWRPTSKHIMEYFESNNQPSFLSAYAMNGQLYGAITARPLYITFRGKRERKFYYIDNLCVHKGMRKKGVAPQLIRTLYYQISRLTPSINIYLFKREGAAHAIVPLTTFKTKGYRLDMIASRKFPHDSNTLIEITKNNFAMFVDFVKDQKRKFECAILPDIANLMCLIEHELMTVYAILEHDRLKAIYVFRDGACHYHGEKYVELVASINACEYAELYTIGFERACARLQKRFKGILVETVGDTTQLALPPTPVIEYANAFYLYNYISRSIDSNKCFILY